MASINEIIKATASKYVGQHEKPNNSGFKDADFEKRMKDVGWSTGLSWCSFFCELVWKEAYNDKTIRKDLDKLFSGSATATYKNFELSGRWKVSKKPVVGALAVWRYGNDWKGHVAVVTEIVDASIIRTIEGNTNNNGEREGVEVAVKRRQIDVPFRAKGLNLVGFVHPNTVAV